ncbi:hypothetical protein M422DRAFT_137603, partial [Sphaerobolus stellatus SS14]
EVEAAEQVPEQELPLVLLPLKDYIYLSYNPLDTFTDLIQVAEGQYGSVYSARMASQIDTDSDLIAVKKVPIPVNGTPKIAQLKHELNIMSKVRHIHILANDGLFFDYAESALWVRMELMDRSLADVLALGDEDLVIEEPVMARLASDILLALVFLNENGIAHRDVRSDNLLINADGVLKLADFSNAVRFSSRDPTVYGIVGIHHWQAPEVRKGHYDASKVDVWSLGATIWECAEMIPPFTDIDDPAALGVRWPPLTRRDQLSHDFHDFLRLCSEPSSQRPLPSKLVRTPFIQRACPREDILDFLNLCRSIEEGLQQ